VNGCLPSRASAQTLPACAPKLPKNSRQREDSQVVLDRPGTLPSAKRGGRRLVAWGAALRGAESGEEATARTAGATARGRKGEATDG
jgi:hypothetical protein